MNTASTHLYLHRVGSGLMLFVMATGGEAAELFQIGSNTTHARDELGFAVSSEADRVAASAPGESSERGAVYVFDCSVAGCTQEARLAPADLQVGDAFGTALAQSGNTLVVSAPGQSAGAVYVFVSSAPGLWSQQAKLSDPGGKTDQRFGAALALLDDTLLVGAAGEGGDRGAVFAFNRTGSLWSIPTLLLAPDGVAGDGFGSALALSNRHALIGAPYEGNTGPGQSYARGAAYAFERLSPTSWFSTPVKLLASTPANAALFGFSVALEGNRAAIGAPFAAAGDGRIQIFDFASGFGWSAGAELGSVWTQPGARLGWSLTLDGEQLVSGAPFDAADPGAQCGATLRHAHAAGIWTELEPLRLRSRQPGDLAGWMQTSNGTRHAAALPALTRSGLEHAGAIAWFDELELVFAEGYEIPHPDCFDAP